MENSAISWTDNTFNPWFGCTKVAPECAHCYAETLMDTRYHKVEWGKGKPRVRTSAANWRKPVLWNKRAEDTRPKVFCASLSDWLDDEVPAEWLADLLELIHETPNLDWLLLTKRPENFEDRVAAATEHMHPEGNMASEWLSGRFPSNVWVGTSAGTQRTADKAVPHLLEIPTRIRFISAEPLVESTSIAYSAFQGGSYSAMEGIHWIICGGESGQGAREMDPAWPRFLRDECNAAGAAFFMKQMGGRTNSRHRLEDLPEDLRIRNFPI